MKNRQKITNKRNIKIGPIATGVLGVVAVAGVVGVLALAPGVTVAIAPFLKKKKYDSKQAIDRSTNALIKNGILKKVIQKAGTEAVTLTRKGRWEAGIRGYLNKERSKKAQKWDGLWRIIIFDVPESKRIVRTELRKAVSLYGFQQLQKSVWVSPFPCDEFVKLVKEYLGISNDVLYMTVNYLENDRHLRKEFNIK